jgi:hypothetical protein
MLCVEENSLLGPKRRIEKAAQVASQFVLFTKYSYFSQLLGNMLSGLFQFEITSETLNPLDVYQISKRLFRRKLPYRKACTYAGQHRHRKVDIRPCPEWNSNPRFPCQSSRT